MVWPAMKPGTSQPLSAQKAERLVKTAPSYLIELKRTRFCSSGRECLLALAGLAFINVAKFLEIVMRSQHRAGINNHEQPVIWVLPRLVDYCCYLFCNALNMRHAWVWRLSTGR